MTGGRLLISDLDGTLLGDDAAEGRFRDWFQTWGSEKFLVYATGRTFESVRALVVEQRLPAPHYVIAALGTEIIEFATQARVSFWPEEIGPNWSVEKVGRVAREFFELTLQPAEFQSATKVSFFADFLSDARLEDLGARLREAALDIEVTYSCRRFLDILPAGVNKGTAARQLAGELGISPTSVVVAGDSGNDAPLFRQEFCGVIVANAHADLHRFLSRRIYRSRLTYADGVVEGVEYWERMARI